MAEEQGLRWWQEEQSQKSHEASERLRPAAPSLLATPVSAPVVEAAEAAEAVTLEDETHDTWAELEAEAVRRAELAKKEDAESVSFHLNRSAVMAQHRRQARALWLLGSVLFLALVVLPIAELIVAPHHHHNFPFGAFGGLFSLLSSYSRLAHWLKTNDKPVVRLAPEGIYLATYQYPSTFLPWGEITSITPRRVLNHRYLEFRVGKRRKYNLGERYLPLSAEALAARIATYETGRQRA